MSVGKTCGTTMSSIEIIDPFPGSCHINVDLKFPTTPYLTKHNI